MKSASRPFSRNRRYVYANVTIGDHARIEKLARESGMSQGGFVRMCIEDWLENLKERGLEELRSPGRPRLDA